MDQWKMGEKKQPDRDQPPIFRGGKQYLWPQEIKSDGQTLFPPFNLPHFRLIGPSKTEETNILQQGVDPASTAIIE